ncbi:hypothetical protein D9615_004764 [Tricholomella constricta]|uniref:Carboxylic ester hydrolase n=1 Tax=Tricholomella constricta TaxID=117010 RepID=A0A8H5HC56_9AGAR|nr:hypothetical protein D9615_004764 [Tricholomella constricta]
MSGCLRFDLLPFPRVTFTKMFIHSLALLAFASAAHARLDGLLVPTRQGRVLGTLVSPTVRQFLGIPYAVANRWEAPTPPPTRTQVFGATNFSDSCLQALNPVSVKFLRLAGARDSDIFIPESENCLTVNIWAPITKRKQRTAVLLWVYGGGFQFGTSNLLTYNGQNIVRDNDDVLVVTFNYRLNIFGFPNAPQLASKTKAQNFGLLDLDAVVDWVYNNIAAFGGDPERITLFGQSAGGIAIDAYTYAHPQDTRVKGVIEQSGSLGILALTSVVLDPTPWNTVASVVGCGNEVTDATQLTCMKTIPFRKLEDAVISTNTNFGPVVDNTPARAAAGNFLHVPLLSGTTQHEGDIFVVGAEELAAGVVIPNLTELLADIETQVVVPVPSCTIFPDISTRPDLRAYHASEISLMFGTFPNPSPPATQKAFSKFVQGAWVAFARNPAHGLLDIGWPEYSPNTSSLAQLGNFFNQTGTVLIQGQLVDFTCASIPTLISATHKVSP